MLLGIVLIVFGATVLWQAELHFLDGIELHLGKIVSNAGVFLLWIQAIKAFFYAPLAEAIQNRTKELETAFSEAEQLRNRMQEMKSEYESRIAATEAAAREQIQAQLREAQQLRLHLMEEAKKKADELVERAEEQIAYEWEEAANGLKYKVVDLTLKATENLISRNVDNEVNRKLVKDFVDQFEITRT
jgi:F-type H+-transporting ATPase subunit b